jgi:CheY-like chemotaxis protein
MSLAHLKQTDILDIYAVTAKGVEELRAGSTQLPLDAIELLVMVDGKSTVSEIARRAGGLMGSQARQIVPLLEKRLIEIVRPGQELQMDFNSFFVPAPEIAAPSGENISPEIQEEARKAAASLDADGYYVSIAREASAKRLPASGSRYTILVVEDNEPLLKVLTVLLRVEGYESRTASNRDQIVAALRTLPSPDAILLDVNLPDTNGFEVLAKIRQHPMLKEIPIIMLTAQTSRRDVLRGLAGGANGYLTKPFEHEVLMRGLRAVLGL